MPTLIGWIARKLFKGKEKEEETQKEEDEREQEFLAAVRGLTPILTREAKEAAQKIQEYLKENKDPLVEAAYRIALNPPLNESEFWRLIFLVALKDAIQKGHHKDPETLTKYILAYTAATTLQLEKIPHRTIYRSKGVDFWEKALGVFNTYAIASYLSDVFDYLTEKNQDPQQKQKYQQYKEKLLQIYHELRHLSRTAPVSPQDYVKYKIKLLKQYGIDIEPYYQEIIQELEGMEKVTKVAEESREQAARILAAATLERLPGWTIKLGLDQLKTPLYTTPQGVHPSIIKYHAQRANPEHEKGTLLHTLITRILAEWEKQIAQGEKPSHPREILDKILQGKLWEYTNKQLTEKEAQTITNELGLPKTLTPQQIQTILQELYRDLTNLYTEKTTPHQLDAEKEAALRYEQLRHLANNAQPTTNPQEILRENTQAVIQAYKTLKHQILDQIQPGKEEEQQLLEKLEARLPTLLQTLTQKLGEKPISQAVAEITQNLDKELQNEIKDRADRAWIVNLARNILLDAPIIAAAQDPTIQWKTLEEKKGIAAALLKLYEEEGKKHRLAPVTADLHWFWERINNKEKPEEMMQEIERIRGTLTGLKAASSDALRLFSGLLDARWFNDYGLMRHEVLGELGKAKIRLLEATYPRIRIREEK